MELFRTCGIVLNQVISWKYGFLFPGGCKIENKSFLAKWKKYLINRKAFDAGVLCLLFKSEFKLSIELASKLWRLLFFFFLTHKRKENIPINIFPLKNWNICKSYLLRLFFSSLSYSVTRLLKNWALSKPGGRSVCSSKWNRSLASDIQRNLRKISRKITEIRKNASFHTQYLHPNFGSKWFKERRKPLLFHSHQRSLASSKLSRKKKVCSNPGCSIHSRHEVIELITLTTYNHA